jgi:hypothetical protein
MYIVSPNCDLRKLPQATAQWARQFPISPALPNFLAELSVAPRPYKLHCPSKAHRPVYMAMLAWLMRGGWVTQLCTFAYVVVWPEIIYEVEHALEADEIARAKLAQSMGHEPSSLENDDAAITSVAALGDPAVAGFGSNFLPLLYDGSDPALAGTSAAPRDLSLSHSPSLGRTSRSESRHSSTTAPRNNNNNNNNNHNPPSPTPTSPSFHNMRNNDNDDHQPQQPLPPTQTSQPTPAEQAAEKARLERIADKAARELAERATAHARKAPPQQTAHPSVNHARHLEGMTPHIILDAKKATGKESLYLSAIGRRLRDRAAAADRTEAATGGGGGGDGGADVDGQRLHHHSHHSHHRHQHHHQHHSHHQPQQHQQRLGSSSAGRMGSGGHAGEEKHNAGAGGDWDERVANAWPVFCKYFNGRSALERIALQEDMKRKDVWNLLTAMSEYLICVRHW